MPSQPPPRPGILDETLDSATAPMPGASASHIACREKFGGVARETCQLTSETHQLLRSRLRAAAVILASGFAIFLIFAAVSWPAPETLWQKILLGEHIAFTAILTFLAVGLCRRCAWSLPLLRLAELSIFGLPALYFSTHWCLQIPIQAKAGAAIPNLGPWIALLSAYGMFIPNTLPRAETVLTALATVPIALLIGLRATDPVVAANLSIGVVLEAASMQFVSCAAAIYGSQIIGGLRREVFEARQFGQYRLRERLGAGGMGEVYLAEHQMLKRPCALKLIHPDKAGDPKALARFEREVQSTAKLTHWNSIEIFDYGRTEGGIFFYVMEYLPGMSLAELTAKHGPLPPERVIHLMRQTCDALAEAHAVGLIHRDIKPGNIFAAQRGGVFDVAKLLDFGLVKAIDRADENDLTSEHSVTGSPLFMSPEQGMNDAVDARSDIYSMGAVMYYLLTGRPPFVESNPIKVLVAHAGKPVEPPSSYRAVPADLEAIVLKCLEKKPDDRFPCVLTLQAALAECAADGRWNRDVARRWWEERGLKGPVCPHEAAAARAALAAEPTQILPLPKAVA